MLKKHPKHNFQWGGTLTNFYFYCILLLHPIKLPNTITLSKAFALLKHGHFSSICPIWFIGLSNFSNSYSFYLMTEPTYRFTISVNKKQQIKENVKKHEL